MNVAERLWQMLVKLKKDEPRFKIFAGDIFEAEPYWLDPQTKVSLLKRISDGYDPECNEYMSNVELIDK